MYHSKTKHTDLDTHYIIDLVANGFICLDYCTIRKKAIEIFTKSMIKMKCVYLRSLLGMWEVVDKRDS